MEPIKFQYKLVDHHTHNVHQPTVDFNQVDRRAMGGTPDDVDLVYTIPHDAEEASPPQRHGPKM